jgi:hypothetical protein
MIVVDRNELVSPAEGEGFTIKVLAPGERLLL